MTIREDSESNKIVKVSSEFSAALNDSTSLKMTITMINDSFDQTSDSIVVSLSDSAKLTAVYVRPGYVEFSPKCDNTSFNYLSDVDSIFDLNWDSSRHSWDGSDLSFINENEIVIDYYFEPRFGMTQVIIEKMYLMQRVIEFSCVWYDSYNNSDDLNVQIGTIGQGAAFDKIESVEMD